MTTKRELEAVVERLNRITNSPLATYTKRDDGKFTANIGNYHLSGAYGGYALHRLVNEAGGVQDVLRSGHVPKAELCRLMHAYIQGVENTKAA